MSFRDDRQAWLRGSLLGNAVFSTGSGLTFAFAASFVAGFIGVAEVALVRAVGIGLLGFAGFVAFVATRPQIDLRAAWAIILGDLSWVVATLPVVMLGWLSESGVVVAVLIADIVLLFAGLQYWGVRRVRGARVHTDARAA